MALDQDEYSSCAIDVLDYGDQTTARESAEIGEDVSEEAEASDKVVQVRPSETTVRTTRSGRTPRPRDQGDMQKLRASGKLIILTVIKNCIIE